jgi:Tol biopolymer transport system component
MLVGGPFQLASEALGPIREAGPQAVSAAHNGTLAFRVGDSRPHTRYTWIDRSGRPLGEVGPLDAGVSPSASPDLGQLVLLRGSAEGNKDVWSMDTRRGVMTQLTTNPAEDVFPMWSPQGEGVIFSSNRGSRWGLYRTVFFSGGSERLLMSSGPEVMFACDESADGRVLVFQRQGAKTGWDLWGANPANLESAAVLVQTPSDERGAQLSPDGKWFAYESNGSGRYEIFVRSLLASGTRVQVSGEGGSQVRWRADGRELFYVATNGTMMAVALTVVPGVDAPKLAAPEPLFPAHVGTVPSGLAGAQYVVSKDGQRFLVNVFRHDERLTPIRWILNWQPRPSQTR